jgi:hypothetical protein
LRCGGFRSATTRDLNPATHFPEAIAAGATAAQAARKLLE